MILYNQQEADCDQDLVFVPDDWLANQRRYLEQKLGLITRQYDDVLNAQRVKIQLQQRNLVAVRVPTAHRGPSIEINVYSLADALDKLMALEQDDVVPADIVRTIVDQHISTWRSDGYAI